MRNYILLLFLTIVLFSAKAQNPGDTIIFHTFNYGMTYGQVWDGKIRDTTVTFPNDPSISYEKILMYYSIRCKNALVSVSGATNQGCGEWDYSCNTYLHDDTRTDSSIATHANYIISNFSGTTFDYVTSPTNSYYRHILKNVSITGTPDDTLSTVGSGTIQNTDFIKSGTLDAKRHYIFTKDELLAAGVVAGNIDGISLDVLSGSNTARFFKIKLMHTTDSIFSDCNINDSSFTEVYFQNTSFTNSTNSINFHTPFNWDGNSNIIVEYNYHNTSAASSISFASTDLNQNIAALTNDDKIFDFNGVNYIETDSYKGINGNDPRTIEAWIKTDVADKEIVSWGKDGAGKKWVIRLNSSGVLRVEVNGGSLYGTKTLIDNKWHHIAVTFSGTNVSDIKLYVDGELEIIASTIDRTIITDTANGINLRVSRGVNNRYWNGEMDDVRIWDVELSQATIAEWMYLKPNNTHPNFSNLQLNYNFDNFQNNIITDNSTFGRNAQPINGGSDKTIIGNNLFKKWELSQNRINTSFMQGNYNLSVVNDTILDAINLVPTNVKGYQIISNAGTSISDIVDQHIDTNLWQANDEITYDAITGTIINTQSITADGSLVISDLSYKKRVAMKFELMSFVTPYGVNLDLGPNGKTYTFDVTDFGPILKGTKRLTVERGGQWQEDMDITFAYIVGTPPRDVLNVQEIWPVDYPSNAEIIADEVFAPRDVLMDANAKAFKVRSTITGHGQEGDFISRNHHLNINGGSNEFTWQVWKDDCSLNPIYPQGGTWIYDRAGWCPGAATITQHSDITQYVTPGQTATLDYSMEAASGTSNYIVSNKLVSYGEINFSLDASVIDIMSPTNNVEYTREKYACLQPTIIIKNTGSTPLSSVVVEYWVNNASERQSYTWNGLLNFGETTEVTLYAHSALWNSLEPTNNQFHVELKNPNNGTDEYSFNNFYNSSFEIPEVIPEEFYIMLRTNNKASETSYKISNSSGVIFEKNNLDNSTFYRDTFLLGFGCYKLEVMDSGDNGLNFWANSDGAGYINLRKLNNQVIKTLEPDFGRKITYYFTVNYPLSYEQIQAKKNKVDIYPNPTNGKLNIQFYNEMAKGIIVYDMLGKVVYDKQIASDQSKLMDINIEDNTPGVYIVQLQFDNRVEQIKVILE